MQLDLLYSESVRGQVHDINLGQVHLARKKGRNGNISPTLSSVTLTHFLLLHCLRFVFQKEEEAAEEDLEMER